LDANSWRLRPAGPESGHGRGCAAGAAALCPGPYTFLDPGSKELESAVLGIAQAASRLLRLGPGRRCARLARASRSKLLCRTKSRRLGVATGRAQLPQRNIRPWPGIFPGQGQWSRPPQSQAILVRPGLGSHFANKANTRSSSRTSCKQGLENSMDKNAGSTTSILGNVHPALLLSNSQTSAWTALRGAPRSCAKRTFWESDQTTRGAWMSSTERVGRT